MKSTGSTVIDDDTSAIFQGYKEVVISDGIPTQDPEDIAALHNILTEGRAVIGGNVDVANDGISLSASFTKIPVNDAGETYKWLPTDIKLSADNGTVNYKSTGKLVAAVDYDEGETKGETAANMVVGYKDVKNDGSLINIVFGGEASLYSDGNLELGQAGDDNYKLIDTLKSTGSYYAANGSVTDLLTGFQKVYVDGKSSIVSAEGGDQKEVIEIMTDLEEEKGTLTASASIGHEGKATGKITVSGASTVDAANSFKDANISGGSTVYSLNGGNTTQFGVQGQLDVAQTKHETEELYDVSINTTGMYLDDTTESVGKAVITDSTIGELVGYKTADVKNSTITHIYDGKSTLSVNNAYVKVQEEGLSPIELEKLNEDLQLLVSYIKNEEYDKAIELAGGKLVDFFKDGNVSAGFDALTFDKQAVGKATIAANSAVTAIDGVKDVKVTGGSTVGEAFGGNTTFSAKNAALATERDEYVTEEGDAVKKITVSKPGEETFNLEAQVESTGSFKAYDSAISAVTGYKNLVVENNTQQIGGEGDSYGVAFIGGNLRVGYNPSKTSDALVIVGSENRQEDGTVLNPIKIGGSDAGLTGSFGLSLESTGSAKITGGNAPVEGELTLKNNMFTAGYKDLTVNENKSQATFMGGDFVTFATLNVKAENTDGCGGAWSDLKVTSTSQEKLLKALANFTGLAKGGHLTATGTLTEGETHLTSTGKANIKNGSVVNAVAGYDKVTVRDSSVDIAIGGVFDTTSFTGTIGLDCYIDPETGKFVYDTDATFNVEGKCTATGKFDAKNSDVSDIFGFKTVALKGGAVLGGTISSTEIDYDDDSTIQFTGSGAGTKLTADGTVFKDYYEASEDTNYSSKIINYNQVELKNLSGDLKKIEFTEGDDKLTVKNADVELGKLNLGDGNDTLKFGKDANFNVSSYVDFGAGSARIDISSSTLDSDYTGVVLKAYNKGYYEEDEGCNVQNLTEFKIAKNAAAYLSSEIYDQVAELDSDFNKNDNVFDIGEYSVARHFSDINTELADNQAETAFVMDQDDWYDGWLDSDLDTADWITGDNETAMEFELAAGNFQYSTDLGKTWNLSTGDTVSLAAGGTIGIKLADGKDGAFAYDAYSYTLA